MPICRPKLIPALMLTVAGVGTLATVNSAQPEVLINYDLVLTDIAGGAVSSIQLNGVRFPEDLRIHGKDLTRTDYFFTISDVSDAGAVLTLEIYRFATRAKNGDPVGEFIARAEFAWANPARLQGENGPIAVDLAFSINRR